MIVINVRRLLSHYVGVVIFNSRSCLSILAEDFVEMAPNAELQRQVRALQTAYDSGDVQESGKLLVKLKVSHSKARAGQYRHLDHRSHMDA